MVTEGGKNARYEKMTNTDLIKILIDKLEQLIRENEQLKIEIERLQFEKSQK